MLQDIPSDTTIQVTDEGTVILTVPSIRSLLSPEEATRVGVELIQAAFVGSSYQQGLIGFEDEEGEPNDEAN